MEFYGNDKGNDESSDSYVCDDTSENDFSLKYVSDSGFTSISLKESEPVSVFRTFFTEEIFNLITDQTSIYGKGKKQSSSQRKTSKWEM